MSNAWFLQVINVFESFSFHPQSSGRENVFGARLFRVIGNLVILLDSFRYPSAAGVDMESDCRLCYGKTGVDLK
jgi:hypothetical protein